MKKIVIKAEWPETSHLLAAILVKIFPECEIHIPENSDGVSESSLGSPCQYTDTSHDSGGGKWQKF